MRLGPRFAAYGEARLAPDAQELLMIGNLRWYGLCRRLLYAPMTR